MRALSHTSALRRRPTSSHFSPRSPATAWTCPKARDDRARASTDPTASTSSYSAAPTASASSSRNDSHVLYCLCGEFSLVLDKRLDLLPRRPIDGSYVLANVAVDKRPKRLYRLNAKADERAVYVKREGGLERQCRLRCPRCELQVGYETVIPEVREAGQLCSADSGRRTRYGNLERSI